MLNKFYPNYMFENVEKIPFNLIHSERIKGIMFDMDNTLINGKYTHTKELKMWIKEMKKQGIKMCIFSNTTRINKVKKVAKEFGMNYIYNGFKPFKFGFKKAEKLLQIDKENLVIIGDQLFTDIYGGNRYGIKTILVKPIEDKEIFLTKMKRPLERKIINKYKETNKYKESLKEV